MQTILESMGEIEEEEAKMEAIQEAIDTLCANLDLSSQGYEISEYRQQINAALADSGNTLDLSSEGYEILECRQQINAALADSGNTLNV